MNQLKILFLILSAHLYAGCFSVSASMVLDHQVLLDSTKIEGEIYNVVAQAPRFPGCEAAKTQIAKNDCATDKMLKFIYANIKYPEIALDEGIQGISVIGFVVSKDGSLHNFKIIRAIGGGCDEEAMRVVKSMPQWEPGLQEGKAVNVQFNLPIKFILDDATAKKNKKNKKNK
jgi:TonB family protein